MRVSDFKKILFSLCAAASPWLLSVPVFAQCPTTVSIPATACVGDNCGAGTPITVTGGSTNPAQYEWIFTGTNGKPDTVRQREPAYNFKQTGGYQVRLSLVVGGVRTACASGSVTVRGFNEFTIGPDNNLGPPEEEICKGTSITLEAKFQQGGPPAGAQYLWSPSGATTPTITTDTAGCYSVRITDPATGCSRNNKVNVRVYKPDPNNPPPPKEESRWYFGNGSGIKFEGGQPKPISGNANTPEGTSSISDATGSFLFYTDGKNVYDKAGNPMPDRKGNSVTVAAGNGLNGGANSTQAVLIVAQPGCNDCEPVYYVFTTTDIGNGGSQLEYSVVDMRLNGGLGQVTQKNTPLFSTSTERLTTIKATPDSTNRDRPETTWIVTHDFNTNTFRVHPLTASGVGQPKTYNVGDAHGAATENGEGYMKVYAKKIVVVIPGAAGQPNRVQVFNFNAATGAVTGPPLTLNLGNAPPKAYGVEIVGDSTLYVSLSGSATDSSKIYGFDLTINLADPVQRQDSIRKTRREVFGTREFIIGALQTDPNGQRLYVAQQGQNALGEITDPTNLASAGYNRQGVPNLTAPVQLGLPNTAPPSNQGYGQGFSYTAPKCTPLNTPASLSFRAQPDRAGGDSTKSAYAWVFRGVGNPFSQTIADAGFGVNMTVKVTFPGPGTYTAELTIRNDCLTEGPPTIAPQTIVIPVQPPKPTARDTSACNGTVITLDPYPGLADPPGVSYAWITPAGDTLVGNRRINARLPGVYTAVIFNQSCQERGTVRVSFSGLTVNLGKDTTLCSGGTLLLDAKNPGAKYEWFQVNTPLSTAQTQTVAPTTDTFYWVRVTDLLTKCVDLDTLEVRVSKRPQVVATVVNATSCNPAATPGTSGSISLASSDPAAATYSYRWFRDGGEIPFLPPTTNSLPDVSPGIYRVIITRPGGCDTTLSVPVINDAPDAVKFKETISALGCADATGTITLDRTDGTPGTRPLLTQYKLLRENGQPAPVSNATGFNTDAANLTFANLPPGVYRLEGTYAPGCRFGFVYEIKPLPNKPQIQAVAAITGCQTATLAVTGTATPANATFQWTLNGSNISTSSDGTAAVTQSGQYIVTVRSLSPPNCEVKDTVSVTFNVPPDYQYGTPPSPFCANETAARPVLTAPVKPEWDTYIWNRPDKSVFVGTVLTATQTGDYTLLVRNSVTGCKDSVIVAVVATPRSPAPVASSQTICAGNPASALIASGTGSFKWYAQPTDPASGITPLAMGSSFKPIINTATPGNYAFYVTQGDCESLPTEVKLTVLEGPVANLGPDRESCANVPVTLNAASTIPGVTYRWNSGQNTPTLTVNRTGSYIVTVSAGTCTSTDTVRIAFLPVPPVRLQRREVPVCPSDQASLNKPILLDAGPGENYTYDWRQEGSPTVIGTERRLELNPLTVVLGSKYTVTVSDNGRCSATDTVTIVDKCEPRVFVPDAFTPNGDVTNNTLEVFYAYIGTFEMQIYNRWGEVIFATKSQDKFWDGTYRGEKVPPGTYTWKIVYTAQYYPERSPVQIQGGVLLLR